MVKPQLDRLHCTASRRSRPRPAGNHWSLGTGWLVVVNCGFLRSQRSATSNHWPLLRRVPFSVQVAPSFLHPSPLSWHMWSTLSHWFQHMPAMPRLLLKFSNTHNFWSVAPKIMNFVLTQSLFRDAFGKKKNSKILKYCEIKRRCPKPVCPPYGQFAL
jgi:hypothetical protein